MTPITDLLSGALWMVRRTVVPVGSGPGSPAACVSRCASETSSAAPAARVLTVTNRVDGETGSLREVLGEAQSGDVIRFAPRLRGATLKLTQGELDINASVRIEGTRQTLDADGLSRIMVLDEPGTSIALDGLIFAHGAAPGDPVRGTAGGAILADGVILEVSRSRFVGNSAAATQPALPDSGYMQSGLGGAIAAFTSIVAVSDADFVDNRAAGADNTNDQQPSSGLGGAVFAQDSTVTLRNSRFTGNAAGGGSGLDPIEAFFSADGGLGAGGAIFATGGPLSADGVTFQRNTATGGDGLDGSADNPYGNGVGAGGNASGGALWVVGRGRDNGDPVHLDLTRVQFSGNTAAGGAAGAQGLPSLAAQQGGRTGGGAFGAVEWVAVSLADVTVRDSLAQGGGVGANAALAGTNVGTGGVAQGGGVLLISPSSVQATHLSVRHNTARGGQGADSADGSGTQAGEGGYAYGGGVLMNNATGSLTIPVAIIPVGIRQSEIVGNRAIGGKPGAGPVPANGLGAGGIASAGGMDLTSVFDTRLVGLRFIGNTARAGQGKSAAGGGLINPYSQPPPGESASLQIQNSVFRGNTAVGGDDGGNQSYRETKGGGFYNLGLGTVVSGSLFIGNSAVGGNDTGSGHLGSGQGGAIYSEASVDPSIEVFNTTFAGNAALGGRRLAGGESPAEPSSGQARGGAVFAANGTTTINGGAFLWNRAAVRAVGDHTAAGGAIEIGSVVDGYINDLITTGTRFVSNAASSKTGVAAGGALAFNGGSFVDDGSTFSGNEARSGHRSGSAYGGALLLEQSTRLNGTTVTRNRALAGQGFGGGIALPPGPDVLTTVQTDVRHNRATTAGDQLWWPTTV